jgi:hypothetical protein
LEVGRGSKEREVLRRVGSSKLEVGSFVMLDVQQIRITLLGEESV